MRLVRFRCGADDVNAFDRLFPSLVAMAVTMTMTMAMAMAMAMAVTMAVRLFLLRYRHHIFDLSGDRLFLRVVRSVPIRYGLHIKGILFNCRVILFSGPFFALGSIKPTAVPTKPRQYKSLPATLPIRLVSTPSPYCSISTHSITKDRTSNTITAAINLIVCARLCDIPLRRRINW